MSLPAEIYSVESVRAIDRAAIDLEGIGGYTLMTRAAEASLQHATERYPNADRWQVVCGAGNNAGDGYVLARLAAQAGKSVSVIAVVSPDSLTGDAATAYADFAAMGGLAGEWQGEIDASASLLIDALLGSGLCRELSGAFADVVQTMNRHDAPVLALDIPSGIHGDSGEALGAAIMADMTVTFVGLKAGLFVGQGRVNAGELRFSDLAIPAHCREAQSPCLRQVTDARLREALPPRPNDAHKGDFGHLLVIGGGPGMPGAVALCAEAALRCGAGKVSVATHPGHHAAIVGFRAELMCHAIDSATDLEPLLAQATSVVVGPGLGQSDWASGLFSVAVAAPQPLVVDADALTLLSGTTQQRSDWVLTPHPGEAARLVGSSTAAIQRDRLAALSEARERYDGNVVLKGAGTLTGVANGAPWVCGRGNPGMASPGMGDVLAGVIGALLAQGIPPREAAPLGVEIHARAGDAAALAGERGLLASDLMQHLRHTVNP